ncbi:type VI secretion system tip protein TssI/VgrG [Polyangium aurulentum]|uniref:type VI secretion system tip protein TssI/VgrG n=1 Tax=Polyangium aurulentum TaxID=2567896 RepID=UPI0010ADF5AE|nr:type VI secretion system tip protein TssI/VgrG [Polyangium aurulentum]UQA55598.1 type VI secretion system tip protein VgrG [Polyangium aurulentum]
MAVLELEFESKEDSLSVRHFQVRESISGLFEVGILARSSVATLDLESFVGRTAAFLMMGGPLAGPRAWSGVCRHIELVQAEAAGISTYYLQIVPQLWLLGLRKRNRIFQQLTIPKIVETILKEYSIEHDFKLVEEHGEHEYRVQFEESDLDFVHRLLEEEGISYFFKQIPLGGKYTTHLMLSDKPEARDARSPKIPFVVNPNEAARKEFIRNVRLSHRVRPGAVAFRDYDFARPDYQLIGDADKASKPEDFYELYRYAPSATIKERGGKPRAPSDPETKQVADIGLQAARRGKREVAFESNCYDLAPGMVFKIDKHPRKDIAEPLLCVEVNIEGDHDAEWSLSGVAAFTDARFRPPQNTVKPVVEGVESAIVVGPKGEEIHTDEYGRVRIQFHWDRDGRYDDKSSMWIRVSQSWAGGAFGNIVLPRVGQEVLVGFLEGDPDQPVLIGRAYNKVAPVPFKLPDQNTVSTWKSQSSPKAEGWNEISFDDAAGKELIYVQAQRNLSKLVKADEIERTGANRLMVVGGNRSAIIGAVDNTVVGQRYALAMVPPQQFDENGEPIITPKTTMLEALDKKVSLTTGKGTTILDDANIKLFADQDVIIKSGGDVIIDGKSHVYINTQDVSGQAPKVDVAAKGGAGKLRGRTLGAVRALFGQAKPAATKLDMERLKIGFRPPTPREVRIAGLPGTSTEQMIARRKVAVEFYKTHGRKWDNSIGGLRPYELPTEMRELLSHLTGIDFKQPVVTGPPPPPPTPLTQWQAPGGFKGQYFAPAGTTPLQLGIGEDGWDRNNNVVAKKVVKTYQIPPDTNYIRTIASDKTDFWSVDKTRQKTKGGGVQYYMGDNSKITEPPSASPSK